MRKSVHLVGHSHVCLSRCTFQRTWSKERKSYMETTSVCPSLT